MIVEQRTYTLYPATVAEYLRRYQEEGLEIQRPILGTMVGYFYTEIGALAEEARGALRVSVRVGASLRSGVLHCRGVLGGG
jgi:hypothetical protein